MADNDLAIEETVRTYLASHGGSVEDPSGQGLTDEMARAIGVDTPFTLTAVLRQMEGNGVITRDVRGLLTYRIALAGGDDPGAAPPGMATTGQQNGAARTAPAAGSVEPDAEAVGPAEATPVAEPVVAGPIVAGPVETGPVETGPVLAGPVVAEPGDATDEAQAPADEKPVSLREALARRGKPPTGPSAAVPASAGPAVTPPVDATMDLPVSTPAPASVDTTATLPVAAPATTPSDKTLIVPAAASAAPPAAVVASQAPPAPSSAEPAGGPVRAVSLREALAAKAAAAPVGEDTAAPPPGASTEASGGPPGTPPFGSATVDSPGSPAPAGGHFVSLRDSATAPPPPTTDLGPTAGTGGAGAATSTTVTDTGLRAGAGAGRGARLRSRLDNPVQEVKAPPSKTTVTAVAVAVAGLVLIAVISAVVSRTTSHPSPNNSFSASTDACHIVTAADATAVLGGDAGQPHFVLGTCVYDNGSSELIIAVFRQQARAMFDAARSSSAQDVNGIGDAAYYVDGRLRVLKGTNLLELTESPIPQNAPTPVMVALASTALSRL